MSRRTQSKETRRNIAIALPSMGPEELEALREPIMSGWVTQGPKVAAFETAFATRHQVQHALATTSCTTALHLTLAALGIGPGDEVIVPAFTWVASANVVLYCGATPILADVDRKTFNLDTEAASSLQQHPEIFMPRRHVPEPHFFLKSWEYARGIEHYQREWFVEVGGEKAVGEKSSSYLFGGRTAAARINRWLPEVGLIVTLRNPVERAWANYRFTVLNGLESLSFDQALRFEADRVASQTGHWREIQPFNYTGRGMYAAQITEFLEVFEPRQLLILKTDDLTNQPGLQFERIFRFLDVDVSFKLEPVPRFTSWSVCDPALQVRCREKFGERFEQILRDVRSQTDRSSVPVQDSERSLMSSLVDNLKPGKGVMSSTARQYLQDVFRDDLLALRELVEFDIDDWLKG